MTAPAPRPRLPAYLGAVAAVCIATGVAWGVYRLLRDTPRFDLSNLVMVYLLAVVVVALRLGRGPAILASFLGVAAFDFLFVPPSLTLAVSDTQYVVTLGVMLAVAGVISALAERVRGQVELAHRRERRTAALLDLSRRLAGTRDTAAAAAVAVERVAEVFDSEAVVLVPGDGGLVAVAARAASFTVDGGEHGAATWAFDHRRPAGAGTDAYPTVTGLYLPLEAARGPVGVLAVRPTGDPLTDPEQRQLLDGFAGLTAAAVDRANLAAEARAAWERVEAEFLRNTLLSSVSHDLRTPLAAIAGAAEALLGPDPGLDATTRRELAGTALDESRRMERVITNLLDVTRLESGGLNLRREWQPLAEVVGAALRHLAGRLAGRAVSVDLPAGLPMVRIDAVSFEQVLLNLVDNAVEYTPPGSPLDVVAGIAGGRVTLSVGDRGPGVPAGTEEQVFQKFFRSHTGGGRRGIGLGLAICRGIVEAHGGRVTVANREGGGAVFRVELPLERPPASPVEPADATPIFN